MSDSLRVHGLSNLWNSPGQNTGVGSLSLLQGIFPGIEPKSPTLQTNSLPAEPQGKPENTGMGSLTLLQWILPTQGSNQGLLPLQAGSLPTELSGNPSHRKALQYFETVNLSVGSEFFKLLIFVESLKSSIGNRFN